MGEVSSSSIYDPRVEEAARILMSMSMSSSSSSSPFPINFPNDSSSSFTTDSSSSSSLPRIFPPLRWTTTKRRTRTIPVDILVEEVMSYFDSLQFDGSHNLERALELVKDKYKLNKKIVAGIESLEYLVSEKRKIKVELEQPKENLAPIMMKNKKQPKQKNIAGLVVEDNRRYKCNECDEVFADYRALGGHTASHNKKKKIKKEKVEIEKTRSDEQETMKFDFNLNDSPDDHIL